jgi:two-component system, NarL family, invasion response regulator UvrY
MIKILLVDDHDLVRHGIKRLLSDVQGMQVIAEATSGEEATDVAKTLTPDIVLMDVKMEGIGGLEAIKRIIRQNPKIRIIAVTILGDEPFPSRVLQAGASGYITKNAKVSEMITAIQTVYSGKKYISPEVAQQMALKHLDDKAKNPIDLVSEREMQILLMITSGQKVNEIADKLCLSPKTVNSYRYRLFEKLEVDSDVELTHFAIRNKLISSED